MTPRFLLFKASAGSGKTYNLALQYIALLVVRGEQEFRRTLAVTFTNKATAEMKDRILLFLHTLAQGKDEQLRESLKDTLRKEYGIGLPDAEISLRCQKALRAILHNYSYFSISTIDAFFQTVLRNMAHELGLNARLQADLNTELIIELAVDSLIENLRHDNRDVLPWMRQEIENNLAEGKNWDVRRELRQSALLLFQEAYLKRSLDSRNLPFTVDNVSRFRQVLEAEREERIVPLRSAAEEFHAAVQATGMAYEDLFSYSKYIRSYIEKLRSGDMEAKFNATMQKMVDDSSKLLKASQRKDGSLLALADELAARLDSLHDLQSRTAGFVGTVGLALQNLSPMTMLGAIDKEVSRLSAERNRFMLARTPIMLRQMIHGDDASFIFERIGTRYNNIMIDEFQDTSRLQWENFRVLLLDNLADGGLNMVVGDIKQSIYRWRNGDWRILHELGTKGHNGTPLLLRPLDENYRSLGRIVDFNNRLFPLAAATLDAFAPDADFHLTDLYADTAQKIMRDPDGGYVRVRLCPSTGKEAQAAWAEETLSDLCRQVETLHRQGLPYEEMAILLRTKSRIPEIIAYFSVHLPDVRLVSSEAFLLGASTAVSMIVAALQVVDDIHRNPVAMHYLAKHYQQDVEQKTVTENDYCLAGYQDLLPSEFMERLTALRQLSLYELCESLYRILRLHEIPRQEAYLFTFFDELSAYLRDNPSDIPTFLRHWDEKLSRTPIPGSEAEGIRIYTIHSSKGLAFHTVLMPFAEWSIEEDNNKDLYWCMPNEQPFNALGSLPVKFSAKRIADTLFEADYQVEHVNRRADELNTLYVAFTRAKANLYIWGLAKGSPYSVADLMMATIPQIHAEENLDTETQDGLTWTFGTSPSTLSTAGTKRTDAPHIIDIPMCSYEGGMSFRQSTQAAEFVKSADKDGNTAPETTDARQLSYIEQGKLLHYIFSHIHTADDIDRVTRQFAQQGILKSEKQTEQVRNLARRGLHHAQVREWYSGRFRIFNECNILIPDPETGKLEKRRPDRVMMDDRRIIVVDFKFGNPKPEYREQVAGYMRILRTMNPSHQVEGWLWYVYKNITESVEA